MLLPAVPIAFGIIGVKRWAFYALMAHALVSVGLGIVDVCFAPAHALPLLVDVIAIGALAARMASVDVRQPYVAPVRRGFRAHPRHEIHLFAEITFEQQTAMGQTHDLSHGGAYIQCHTEGLEAGQKCRVRLQMRERELRVQGRVIRVCPEGESLKPAGFALQFTNMKSSDIETIETFVAVRKHPRVTLSLPIELVGERAAVRTEAVNLSLGGCFVRGGKEDFQPGDRITVKLDLEATDVLECIAEVAWLASEDAQQPGLALQFVELTKRDRRRLRDRLERKPI
jgi:Tfp pilus assembly protein PilZ